MDSDLEFAVLSRPRVAARQFLEEFKSGRHEPQRTLADRERRLAEIEREIKQELFDQAMNAVRLSRAEAPRLHPEYTVGIGGILTGGEPGALLGRDFTG